MISISHLRANGSSEILLSVPYVSVRVEVIFHPDLIRRVVRVH